MDEATEERRGRGTSRSEPTPVPEDGQAETSTSQVYDSVREAILDGSLEPGSVFSQVELSARLGVSRTPLREAIRRLQGEGLVESEERRRVKVASLDLDDLGQLYGMRIMLEPLCVRLTVPGLSAAELASIRKALDGMSAAVAAKDRTRIRGCHRQFHFGLFSGGGERLVRQVQDLWEYAERYRRLYSSSAKNEMAQTALVEQEHEEILAAAAAGEAAQCGDLVARHLGHTALTLFARIDYRHDTTTVREALEMALHSPVP